MQCKRPRKAAKTKQKLLGRSGARNCEGHTGGWEESPGRDPLEVDQSVGQSEPTACSVIFRF